MKTQNKNWFKEMLGTRQITQRKLAQILGLDEGAFSRTLSGSRKPQLKEMTEMSKILGVSLVEILAHFGAEGEFTNTILVEWIIENEATMTKLASPMEIEHEYASLVTGVYCQVRNGHALDRSIIVLNPVSSIVYGRLSAIEMADKTWVLGVLRQNYNPKLCDILKIDHEVLTDRSVKTCLNVKSIFPV